MAMILDLGKDGTLSLLQNGKESLDSGLLCQSMFD